MTNPELATRICEKLADILRQFPVWNTMDVKLRASIIAALENMIEKELNKHRDS